MAAAGPPSVPPARVRTPPRWFVKPLRLVSRPPALTVIGAVPLWPVSELSLPAARRVPPPLTMMLLE